MQKKKRPQRSRLVRKWDGTSVDETQQVDAGADAAAPPDAASGPATAQPAARVPTLDELIFNLEPEDEMFDSPAR